MLTRGDIIAKSIGASGIIIAILGMLISAALCGPGCGSGNGWAPNGSFNWHTNTLSDLGLSRVSLLFNSTLFLGAALVAIFIALFAIKNAGKAHMASGGIIASVGAASTSLIGIFTEHYQTLHLLFSAMYLILTPIGILVIGYSLFRSKMVMFGKASMLLGITSLLFALFFIGVFAAGEASATLESLPPAWITLWITFAIIKY